MFQYYTNEFIGDELGYDVIYNYEMSQGFRDFRFSPYDLKKFNALAKKFNLPPFEAGQSIEALLPYTRMIKAAIDNLKQNNLLNDLAAAYMRQKIVTEKLHKKVAATGAAIIMPQLLRHDKYAEDLQTMIYHFLKEAYGKFIVEIKAAPQDKKLQSGNFLSTFVPSFFEYPYYAHLKSLLEVLSAPMEV